jgi:hypothetical protein
MRGGTAEGWDRMSTTKVNLWFNRETEKARHYSKLPPIRNPTNEDMIWIPISIIEHTSKNVGHHHIVTLPDWFVEKEGL